MSQRITFNTTLVQREKLDEWLEKLKNIQDHSCLPFRQYRCGFVAIVTLKTIQECCRVCNKSYFFLCLNLRQLVLCFCCISYCIQLESEQIAQTRTIQPRLFIPTGPFSRPAGLSGGSEQIACYTGIRTSRYSVLNNKNNLIEFKNFLSNFFYMQTLFNHL